MIKSPWFLASNGCCTQNPGYNQWVFFSRHFGELIPKLFIFIISKNIFWIEVSIKYFNLI